MILFFLIFYLLVLEKERKEGEGKREREGGRERERNINLLFHLFMHSLVYFCMCPDWGSNLQLWHTGTMLSNQLSYLARL